MHVRRVRDPVLARGSLQALSSFLLRVVQFPGYGVEQADERGFADPPAEEGVSGQRAEGVVADLRVGGGGAAVDESEVRVCFKDWGVEEDEPDVDSQRGLHSIPLVHYALHFGG